MVFLKDKPMVFLSNFSLLTIKDIQNGISERQTHGFSFKLFLIPKKDIKYLLFILILLKIFYF